MNFKELLTIIITSSPIKSNPDTSMISSVLKSFEIVQNLDQCQKIIIFDGYKMNENQIKYKKGVIDQQSCSNYIQFIKNIKELKIENTQFIEREQRFGFAENLLYCLNIAKTEFVIVVQHDQIFLQKIDLAQIFTAFQIHQDINYIGFLSSCTNNYIPKLIQNKDFLKFGQDLKEIEQNQGIEQYFQDKYGISIIPLPFWYDKTHISRRKYYLELFNQKHYDHYKQKYIRIKNFVEDSFGQAYLSQCKELGFFNKQFSLPAQQKIGCYLYYTQDKTNIISHLDGRGYCDEQLLIKYINMEKNKK